MFIRNENLKRKSLAKLVPRFHQNLNTPPERKILSNSRLLNRACNNYQRIHKVKSTYVS
jgi:hypothetical protein